MYCELIKFYFVCLFYINSDRGSDFIKDYYSGVSFVGSIENHPFFNTSIICWDNGSTWIKDAFIFFSGIYQDILHKKTYYKIRNDSYIEIINTSPSKLNLFRQNKKIIMFLLKSFDKIALHKNSKNIIIGQYNKKKQNYYTR